MSHKNEKMYIIDMKVIKNIYGLPGDLVVKKKKKTPANTEAHTEWVDPLDEKYAANVYSCLG